MFGTVVKGINEKAVVKIHIRKNFCKDTTPGRRKSAMMRRLAIRGGKSVSSTGHHMQGG